MSKLLKHKTWVKLLAKTDKIVCDDCEEEIDVRHDFIYVNEDDCLICELCKEKTNAND